VPRPSAERWNGSLNAVLICQSSRIACAQPNQPRRAAVIAIAPKIAIARLDERDRIGKDARRAGCGAQGETRSRGSVSQLGLSDRSQFA